AAALPADAARARRRPELDGGVPAADGHRRAPAGRAGQGRAHRGDPHPRPRTRGVGTTRPVGDERHGRGRRPRRRAIPTTDTHPPSPRAGAEVVEDDTPPPPGRPVRLELPPPGFWRSVGGAVLAVLAPFFAILIGSTMGNEDPASRMDPLYWGFFIGIVVGG